MSEAYSCTFADCGMVFLRAYELKKHIVTHEDPDRVFYCPDCDFITLQKKNLRIHRSTHTGEKTHQCPDTIDVDSSPESQPRTERCAYRTNDPAALTKHRKKIHGYIPPLSRSRSAKVTLRKRHQKKDGKVSRHPRPPKGPLCRKPSRVIHQAHNATDGAGYTSTSSESSKDSPFFCPENRQSMGSDTSGVFGYDSAPSSWKADSHEQSKDANCSEVSGHDPSPFLWQGDVDAYGRPVDINSPFMSGFDPSIFSDATPISPHLKTEQHDHGYGTFEGLPYHPEPTQVPPLIPAGFLMPAGQAGCLGPEWMTETGLGGWDQSILSAPNHFYTFHA